jgi:hypothetical protein
MKPENSVKKIEPWLHIITKYLIDMVFRGSGSGIRTIDVDDQA